MKLQIAGSVTMMSAVVLTATLLSGFKGCASTPADSGATQCEVAADCEGLPSIACVGEWSCLDGLCMYDCEATSPPDGCLFDEDCGDGYTCEGGADWCGMPGNSDAAGVPLPDDCYGQCVKKEQPDGCTCDDDCESGQLCAIPECMPCPPNALCAPCATEGVCIDVEPPPVQCSDDLDCPQGQICELNACPPCPPGAVCGPCALEGQCVDGEKPPIGCTANSECGPGEYCAFDWCEDVWACECPPDSGCDCPMAEQCYGQCEPIVEPGCTSDAECGPGMYCALEWCEGGYACDCADGDDCDCPTVEPTCGGTCQPIVEPGCGSDADCGPGYECQGEYCLDWCPAGDSDCCGGGFCVARPEPGICDVDSDCAMGQVCVFDDCDDWYCDCPPGAEDCACPMFEACSGTCQDAPEPGPCSGDWECGPNQQCEFEYCETVPCWCDEDGDCDCPDVEPMCWGTCKDAPEAGCSTDSDCAQGEHCEVPLCLLWCPEGEENCCGDGVCVADPEPEPECVISGCSGEICAAQPVGSMCIWQDWYQCLALASCEAQANGTCGWTQNDEFDACMAQFLED